MAAIRCCQCNGKNAKCIRCSCWKSELPCSYCLPGKDGVCQNSFGRGSGPPDSLDASPRVSPSPQVVDPSSDLSTSTSAEGGQSSSAVAALPDTLPGLPGPSLPSFPEIFRLPVATLFHVPKAVRDQWAGVLSVSLKAVLDRPKAWRLLFMLPKCILFLRSRKKSQSLVTIVRDRLACGFF